MNKIATKIIVQYEDGTEKNLKNGVATEFIGDTMHLDMLNISRMDMVRLTYGMLSTLDKMGLTEMLMAYTQGIPIPDENQEDLES